MGRVRTRQIKAASEQLVEMIGKNLASDFEHNKKIIDEYVQTGSKRLRNFIAGYVTHLIKKQQKNQKNSS